MKRAKWNSTCVLLRNVPANTIVYVDGRWGVTEGAPGRGKKRVVDFWWEGRERIAADISVQVVA